MSVVEVTFPGNLAQVPTIPDLRDLPSYNFRDGDLYGVRTVAGLYSWEADSLAVDDGAMVIKPDDLTPLQAGRWILGWGSIADTLGSSPVIAPSQRAVKQAVDGLSDDIEQIGTTLASASGSDGVGYKVTPTAPLRTIASRLRDQVSIRDFGAVGNGIADDTPAFIAAIAYLGSIGGGALYLPGGTYRITDRVDVSYPRITIRGAGRSMSVIKIDSATADAIRFSASPYQIEDLTIDRSVAATSGAGIRTNDGMYGIITNVICENHFNGFIFGATSSSQGYNLSARSNYDAGFLIYTATDYPAAQWTLRDCISEKNGKYGWSLFARYNSSGPYQTGPSFDNCASYANDQGGWVFSGDAGTGWNDINAFEIYSSFDGGHGIALYNPGANNQFHGVFSEGSGTAYTGRGQATPPSGFGAGILIDGAGTNESYLTLSGMVQHSSNQGLSVTSTSNLRNLTLTAFTSRDNGVSGSQKFGIEIESTVTRVIISSTMSKNIAGTSQIYGLNTSLSIAPNIFVWGADFSNNATGASNITSSNFGAWQAAT